MVVDHGSVGVVHDYPSLRSHARERRLRRISPFGSVRSASVSTKLTHVIRNLYLSVVSISYNKTKSSCQPFFRKMGYFKKGLPCFSHHAVWDIGIQKLISERLVPELFIKRKRRQLCP